MTNPFSIRSCHNCEPDKWIVEGESEYYYKCDKCRSVIKSILKYKDYKPMEVTEDE